MNKNERLHALKILKALLTDKTSLGHSLAPEEITPLTKEMCFGFCRHYFRLQAIANHLVPKKPKEIEIWIILLIGLYQLHYMNIPDYAVVKETVALLESIKKSWAKGLVNAVLRNFCRKSEEIIEALVKNEDFVYGQPPFLLKQFKTDWPNHWQQIALENDEHPPMTLRVNIQKKSVLDYLDVLKASDIEAELHPHAPQALTLKHPTAVHNLPGFKEGWFSVQDAAAQLAVSLLALKPGLRILDACCAPGGKTCHILESEPSLQECLALDLSSERLKKVKANLSRLSLKARVLEGDALQPELWWDKNKFDRILLDAPCSAIGVIRRHSDIKLLRTKEDIDAVSQTQHALLKTLWPLLNSGGLMLYATCSVVAQENEQRIAEFVKNQPDCKVVKIHEQWGRSTAHGLQILPGDWGMDGFFYSLLLKNC